MFMATAGARFFPFRIKLLATRQLKIQGRIPSINPSTPRHFTFNYPSTSPSSFGRAKEFNSMRDILLGLASYGESLKFAWGDRWHMACLLGTLGQTHSRELKQAPGLQNTGSCAPSENLCHGILAAAASSLRSLWFLRNVEHFKVRRSQDRAFMNRRMPCSLMGGSSDGKPV